MKEIQGQGVSGGIAEGKLYFLSRSDAAVNRQTGRDPDAEKRRLTEARRETVRQLNELAEKGRAVAGEESALLFEIHAMLTEDEDFVACMEEIVESEKCNAEYAAQAAGEKFAAALAQMDDPYMRERAADIRDVARRIMENLDGSTGAVEWPDEPIILAADDLAPSQTIQLDRGKILAFVTRQGSASSHTAILARTMGIPAVCGLGEALKDEYAGTVACVNGESGQVFLDPDEEVLRDFRARRAAEREIRKKIEEMRGLESVTLDGQRIDVYCNIGSVHDLDAAIENDGQGIGLFRSEFLYLAKNDYPGEEEQFLAYKAAVEKMDGRRVVIRTLDVGADKQAAYFGMPKEENPALGMRAVRFCLNHPDIFRTQLRALYRASAYGKLAILFPMIASVWEVLECRKLCRAVMNGLDDERIPYNPATELGIMIETPASALMAEELAHEVDFFSVGTNDLIQYTLACDRQSGELGRFCDPHHPAVLRAIRMAAEAAHRAGIWIGICGELAADHELLPAFLAMKIDELSVSPSEVLPLRAAIRQSRAKD